MSGEMERYDILGLGCATVDDLLFVDAYPPADGKTPVRGRQRQGGGLTATALVAAARLGARCHYAGTLGEDELSQFVEGRLHAPETPAREGRLLERTAIPSLPGSLPVNREGRQHKDCR